MKKIILKFIEYLNPTLLLAPLIPFLYCLKFVEINDIGYDLYFKSMIIIIPIILMDYLEKKCRHFITYLISGIIVMVVTISLAYLLGPVFMNNMAVIGLPIIIGLESFAIFIHHFRVRILFAKQLEEDGRITKSDARSTIFSKPSLYFLILFGILYVLALGFQSKYVCNEIFISSIIYIFIYVVSEFISETDEYMEIHNDVAGIPKRRVYGIGAGMTGLLVLCIFLSIIPSIILMNQRPYYDLTSILNASEEIPFEADPPQTEATNNNAEQFTMEDLTAGEEPFVWPEWVKFLANCFVAAIFIGIAWGLIKAVLQIFASFEKSFEDDEDIIEKLEEDAIEDIEFIGNINSEADLETRKIRKQYKKVIRKARKDRPQSYETPTEIEEKAGIKEKPEMIELHKEYERVRYGK